MSETHAQNSSTVFVVRVKVSLMTSKADFDLVSTLIRSRRTCKEFDGSPIEKPDLTRLLELAIWAPNHRLNEPWRFRVLSKNGILTFIEFLSRTLTREDSEKFSKLFEKLKMAGAIIHVTCLKDVDPEVDLENYAATCAATQNILLAATAAGLQSYWGTGKIAKHTKTLEYLQLTSDERFVAWVWLGHGKIGEAKSRSPIENKTTWFD